MKPVLLRILLWAAAAGIASAFVLAAPAPDPVGSGTGAATAAARPATARTSARFEMQSRSGTLKTYHAGQSIVIAGPDGRLKRLPVDPAARVDRGLARGQQVNVISMTDETGRERVSAISRSAPAAAEKASGTAPSPER
jgi:hypothetical protein